MKRCAIVVVGLLAFLTLAPGCGRKEEPPPPVGSAVEPPKEGDKAPVIPKRGFKPE